MTSGLSSFSNWLQELWPGTPGALLLFKYGSCFPFVMPIVIYYHYISLGYGILGICTDQLTHFSSLLAHQFTTHSSVYQFTHLTQFTLDGTHFFAYSAVFSYGGVDPLPGAGFESGCTTMSAIPG